MVLSKPTLAADSWLLVTSEPPGAAISVDGVYRGTTPGTQGDSLRLRVPVGKRQVTAERALGDRVEGAQQQVAVKASKGARAHLRLRPEPRLPSPATPAAGATSLPGPLAKATWPELLIPGLNF